MSIRPDKKTAIRHCGSAVYSAIELASTEYLKRVGCGDHHQFSVAASADDFSVGQDR